MLTDYSEARLIKIDPRLVVLAPFTVPKKTSPEALTHKARHWHDRVCKVYPVAQQDDALAILGLFMFDRFRTLDRRGVIKMLNLDWNNNPMVQELRQEGMQQGMQRALMEVLHNRFANVPESMVTQIETIESTELLTELLRKALQCNDKVAFEKILFHHLNR